MIKNTHLILYVEDQTRSTGYYSKVLNQEPRLNVPGMTEFQISENTILGLMPSAGIKKLLNKNVDTIPPSRNKVKAELYLIVDNISNYLDRAKSQGSRVLSEAEKRDWGHNAAYVLDPDNYIIAFAEEL